MLSVFEKQAERVWRLAIALSCLTTGCGTGLLPPSAFSKTPGEAPGEAPPSVPTNHFSLSPSTIRPNDCTLVTVTAVDGGGVPLSTINRDVTISVNSTDAAYLYTDLSLCQTYDLSQAQTTRSLTLSSGSVSLYVRADDTSLTSMAFRVDSTDSNLLNLNGTLNLQFNGFMAVQGPNLTVNGVKIDSTSNNAYVFGQFTRYGARLAGYVMRLLSDGTPDPAFVVETLGHSNMARDLAIQSDGKVVLVGGFSVLAVSREVVRLNSDGSVDSSFVTTGTGFNSTTTKVLIQQDGKILVLGAFTSFNGVSRNGLARLNSDGSLDTTFAFTGTGLNSAPDSFALQSDGKILVSGFFTNYNGTPIGKLARLNADGTLDSSFVLTGTGINASAQCIAVQPDGAILIGGWFTSYNGTARPYLARLLSDGSLDSSFVQTGTGLNTYVTGLEVQPDGKVYAVGAFTSYNGTSLKYIARINANGTLDTAFAQSGSGLNGLAVGLSARADGKVMVVGGFSSYNGSAQNRVTRLLSDASLDPSLVPTSSGQDTFGPGFSLQSDGRMLVAGYLQSILNYGVRRILSNGDFDSSFAMSGTGFNDYIAGLTPQSDFKVLVGGGFTNYNGSTRKYIARLQSDGTLDSSFTQTGAGFNAGVTATAVQSDGRIIAVGYFTSYNGSSRGGVARLLSTGALDTSFALAGTGFNSGAVAVALQSDGKIVVAGGFTSYNGVPRRRVARLNTDGSLDTTFFETGTGLNSDVRAIALQSDGKLLVGGDFTSYNGTTARFIARLLSDGSLDPSFAPTGTGVNSYVYDVCPTADGRILITGWLSQYNGTAQPAVARLFADGTLDTTFSQTGQGLSGIGYAVRVQSDRKILVSGGFTSYDEKAASYLVRLTHTGKLD
jgi:uncharacterized delta-60 repeat protein